MISIQKLLDPKQLYPCIDTIVSPRRCATQLIDSGDDQRLTLPGCLLSDAPKRFPPILVFESLEDNLCALRPIMMKPRKLAKQLLNPCQFLNRLSELALAHTLLEKGWWISLNEKFFGNKDADIVARRGTEENFIDVINIAPMSLPTGVVNCRDIIQETSNRSRIVQKVVEKFKQKFEVALERGWRGRAWVAPDFAKNDEENVQAFVQDFFQTELEISCGQTCSPRMPKINGDHTLPL